MFSEEEYKNSKSRLGFKCSKHIDEETQYTSYNSLSRGFGIGCTHCRNEKLREEFKIKNPRDFFIEKGFIPLFENEEYINSNHDLPFICKAHQEYGVQETNIKNVRYNKGCKYCSDSKSKGEIRIREFLDQFNSIQYKLQESFSDCKYRIPLKFDFLVFSSEILQLVIEYDGLQHFEPVDFAGKGEEWALKQFKETQKRDEIKDKYCEKNNIPILRIPYWDFDNIENILENTLMKYII
jgi:very-short-patch-repair endonuclease